MISFKYKANFNVIFVDRVPKVSYRFPEPPKGKPNKDESTIARFCFPDAQEIQTYVRMPSQNYSFMLTSENGSRQFGYCLRLVMFVHRGNLSNYFINLGYYRQASRQVIQLFTA